MRIELKSVLTWREDVESALEKLLGVVRPRAVRPAAERFAGSSRPRPPGTAHRGPVDAVA
jgi:hypothetical protein